MGFVGGQQANFAYWNGRPRRASHLALDGLRYLPDGIGAVRLHCLHAMAAARLRQRDEARAAITAGHQTREGGHHDELHDEIGGEFACAPAKESYLAGTALADVHEGETDAISELQTALRLYQGRPPRATKVPPRLAHWISTSRTSAARTLLVIFTTCPPHPADSSLRVSAASEDQREQVPVFPCERGQVVRRPLDVGAQVVIVAALTSKALMPPCLAI